MNGARRRERDARRRAEALGRRRRTSDCRRAACDADGCEAAAGACVRLYADGQLSPSSAAAPAQARRRHAARSRRSRWRRPCSSPPPASSACRWRSWCWRAGWRRQAAALFTWPPAAGSARESEADVRRVLERLVRDGWQVRHAVDWPGRGDLDHVVRAPSGIGVCDRDQDAALDARAPGAHERRGTLAGAATPAVPARRGAGAVRHARAARSSTSPTACWSSRWTGSCRRCAPAPWAVASNAASVLLCAELRAQAGGVRRTMCAACDGSGTAFSPSIRCDGGSEGRSDRPADDTAHAPIAGLRATSGARRRAGRRASCARVAARC